MNKRNKYTDWFLYAVTYCVDGSVVEERCSMIRKQSGLDAKTSFFTLAPGSIHDLQEFVNM